MPGAFAFVVFMLLYGNLSIIALLSNRTSLKLNIPSEKRFFSRFLRVLIVKHIANLIDYLIIVGDKSYKMIEKEKRKIEKIIESLP